MNENQPEKNKDIKIEKICPIMAIGKISGFKSNSPEFLNAMPKCMQERCGLWVQAQIPPDLKTKGIKYGHCGLISLKQEYIDYML